MANDTAIVVACFDRPAALQRLLGSLARARITREVPLVISIDRSERDDVTRVAQEYVWPYGLKQVVLHEQHLGLREHILHCGDLTQTYGQVILFEDDLYAGPFFDQYTIDTASYYAADDRIAGISLYCPSYNETAGLRFVPYDDGADVFFMQLPSSWGQCWSASQWRRFREWCARHSSSVGTAGVPPNVLSWPETSWKRYFVQYMVDTDRYFVYPRTSHSTNFMEPGVHHKTRQTCLQVPLQTCPRERPSLVALQDSAAVYDAYCEVLPAALKRLSPGLRGYDFAVDFYGAKPIDTIREPFVLTCRHGPQPLRSFGRSLKPHEVNVILDLPGEEFFLHETAQCERGCRGRDHERLSYYYDIPAGILLALAIGIRT